MSFQKSSALDSCSVILRHIPQRAACVVTQSLLQSGTPISIPHLDGISEAVVADVQVSNLKDLFKAEDFSPSNIQFFESVLKAISRTGGDLINLTPDGLTVVWSPNPAGTTSKLDLLGYATVCAFEIQEAAGKTSDASSKAGPATVKAGIAVGQVFLAHTGGRNGHKRHVIVGGSAHRTAADGLKLAGTGEIAVCPDSFKLLQDSFQHRAMRQRFYVLLRNRDSLNQVELPGGPASPFALMSSSGTEVAVSSDKLEELEVESELEAYVPSRVSRNFSLLERGKDGWLASLDRGAVLCVCVGVDITLHERNEDNMAAVDTMQLLMEAIQEVVAAHSGVLASVSHTTDSNPDTLTFFCSFGPSPTTRESYICRALWAALALQPLFSEIGATRMSCGLSVGQVRPLVLFDNEDPFVSAVAHSVVFGAALANAGELATASLAKAAKELTSAVVMCDNDFVETMASISGVDVVSLLGRFCKVNVPSMPGDIWQMHLEKADNEATTVSVFEDILYPQDITVKRMGEGRRPLYSLDLPTVESEIAEWSASADARVRVVEGFAGSGKTTILRRLVQNIVPANYPNVQICAAVLDPITASRAFGGIGKLIVNYLRGWLVRGARGEPSDKNLKAEAEALLAGLPGGFSAVFPLLAPALGLLPYADTPALCDDIISNDQREVVCRALCVFLVQQITLREGQSLLVVDNGLFLDEFSWGVFEDLIATNNPDSLLERWRDIYADNVPTVVANAVRAFKGAAAIPVLINVFMRPLHENIDCLSSEVASAAESVRGCSRCRVIQFVSWGGAALKLGSLSKEQSKVVDSALRQLAAEALATPVVRRSIGVGEGGTVAAGPIKVRSAVVKLFKALSQGTFLLATEIASLLNALGDAAISNGAKGNEVHLAKGFNAVRMLQVSPRIRDFFSWQLCRFPLNAQLVLKTLAVAGSRDNVTPVILWRSFPFDTERTLVFNICEKLRVEGIVSFEPPDIYGDGEIWFCSPFVFKMVRAQVTAQQSVALQTALAAATPEEDTDDEADEEVGVESQYESSADGILQGPNATNKKLMLECAEKCKNDKATQALFDGAVAKARQRLRSMSSPSPRARRRSSIGIMFEQTSLGADDDDSAWAAAQQLEERFQARGEDGGGRDGRSIMFLSPEETAERVTAGDKFAPKTLLDMLALYVPWQLVLYLAKNRPNILSDDPFSSPSGFGKGSGDGTADGIDERSGEYDADPDNDQHLPISIALETACLVVHMKHRVTLSASDYSRRSSRMIVAGAGAEGAFSDADDGDAAVARARLQAEAMDVTFSVVAGIAREFNGVVIEHTSSSVAIVWPDEPTSVLRHKVRAATLCALKISAAMPRIQAEQELSTRGVLLEELRCGVGDGTVTLLVAGGCLGRLYCIPTGPGFRLAHDAVQVLQTQKMNGAVCLSGGCCAQIAPSGDIPPTHWCQLGQAIGRGKFQIATGGPGALDASNMEEFQHARTIPAEWYEDAGLEQDEAEEDLEYSLGRFLPGPVINHMSHEFPDLELWSNELRTVSCAAILVEVTSDDLRCPMLQSRVTSGNSQDERLRTAVHLITQRIQYEAYKYEGTVISVDVQTPNKAMRDGKPVVAVVRAALGYGLPPLAHEDDCARAMLAALAVRAELLGNASRTQFSAVACGVASGYVFAGALGCQSASSSGRAGDSAAGGFKSATRRYAVVGATVELALEISSQILAGKLKCASWTAVDGATASSVRGMLACSGRTDGGPINNTSIFTVDPPIVRRVEAAANVDGKATQPIEFNSAVHLHPSEATYSAQIRRLWAYKRHLMQPEMSPALRNSDIATQLANIFRMSLNQRGGRGRGSPTHSSPARSPNSGSGNPDEAQAPVVVILQGDAGSGKTSLISHCLATTRMRRSQFVAAFAPAFQRRKRFSTIGNLIRQYLSDQAELFHQAQQAMLKSSGGATGGDISANDIDEPDIQNVVSQIVSAEAPDLLPYISLLNGVLLMKFPTTEDVNIILDSDRDYEDDFGTTGTIHLLLLAIMWYICDQKQRRLLILDDAYFTDEYSWAVIEDLATAGNYFNDTYLSDADTASMRLPYAVCAYMDQNAGVRGRKLALCISLRSLHTHGSIAMREIAPAYHHLEALPATQIISIEPMDVSGVAAFIQTSYGPEPAIAVSDALGKLMHSLSNGNPLYVKLAMDVLQTETPFFRKTPDGLGVSLDIAKECSEASIPLPNQIEENIEASIDVLSVREIVILKILAALSAGATVSQISAILARVLNAPVDPRDLDQMLNTLSSCGLVYEPVVGTWKFTSIFVAKTVTKRTLPAHLAVLKRLSAASMAAGAAAKMHNE